jgi:hypothetical protein
MINFPLLYELAAQAHSVTAAANSAANSKIAKRENFIYLTKIPSFGFFETLSTVPARSFEKDAPSDIRSYLKNRSSAISCPSDHLLLPPTLFGRGARSKKYHVPASERAAQ